MNSTAQYEGVRLSNTSVAPELQERLKTAQEALKKNPENLSKYLLSVDTPGSLNFNLAISQFRYSLSEAIDESDPLLTQ